ncbi:MAG: hypothetical protein WAW63_03025 [Candidatus Saccharimonadales bacterium]
MTKQTKNQHWLAIYPVHFHVGMYVGIAALLITMMKSSEGMIAVVYSQNAHGSGEMLHNTHMREAETHIGHAQLSFARPTRVSGT